MAMIGQGIAWALSIANAFIWHRRFVFDTSKETFWRSLAKTYLGYGFGLLLSTVLTYVLITWLGVSTQIVPFITLPIIGPVNFVVVKCWSFRDMKKRAKVESAIAED